MLIGYMRLSKADGSQACGLQRDALLEAAVGKLCKELGITRQTLYRHISPNGKLHPNGVKLLSSG